MNTYVALDLETTGVHPESSEILEIGAVKVVDGEIVAIYDQLVNVPGDVPPLITEITGITREMADGGIEPERAIREICAFCEGFPLLGHNISFDHGFLKTKAAKYGLKVPDQGIDTLKIARKKRKDLESRALSALCEHYGIDNKVSHRAYEDALSAMKLYRIFQQEYAGEEGLFDCFELVYKVKKQSPMTEAQSRYLAALVAKHGLTDVKQEGLTKSEASRQIDHIIRNYGK